MTNQENRIQPEPNRPNSLDGSGDIYVAAFSKPESHPIVPSENPKPLSIEDQAALDVAKQRVGHKTGPIAVRSAEIL